VDYLTRLSRNQQTLADLKTVTQSTTHTHNNINNNNKSTRRSAANNNLSVLLGNSARERRALLQQRIDRSVTDYCLRRGYIASAEQLSSSAGLTRMVDLKVFHETDKVARDLQENRSTKMALAWCGMERTRLSRVDSDLELSLHIQNFVEMLQRGETQQAIEYSQTKIAPLAIDVPENLAEVQKALTLVMLTPTQSKSSSSSSSATPLLQSYLGDERWALLASKFKDTHARVNGLFATSSLEIHLKAGFQALKSPHCTQHIAEDRRRRAASSGGDVKQSGSGAMDVDDDAHDVSAHPGTPEFDPFALSPASTAPLHTHTHTQGGSEREAALALLPAPDAIHGRQCPCCTEPFSELFAHLQPSARSHSRLICGITGVVMDERNPPLALPNGQVYSKEALTQMAAANQGYVLCPRTALRVEQQAEAQEDPSVVRERLEASAVFKLSDCRAVYVL
jgi:macrophage erythroblast attacher